MTIRFDNPDPRMKAGSSALVKIVGKDIANALTVPRQAVFQKNGKTCVFAKVGDRFERRDVKVLQRTEPDRARRSCRGECPGRARRSHRAARRGPSGDGRTRAGGCTVSVVSGRMVRDDVRLSP